MKINLRVEAMIANRYPLYISRFTGSYGKGYEFEGRGKLREELQTLFPSQYSPVKYDNPYVFGGWRSELPENFDPEDFRKKLQLFLEESRKKSFLSMFNSLDGSGKFGMDPILEKLLTLEDRKEYGLANFMQGQGNIRGVPIGSPLEEYTKEIDRFTTRKHSLHDNQLYVLTSQMNTGNDCLAGVAPILLNFRLREEFPKDTLILAKKYLPVIQMQADNHKRCKSVFGSHENEKLVGTPVALFWQELRDDIKREYEIKWKK